MRGSVIIFGSTLKARQQKVVDVLEKELGQKTNFNYLVNFPDIKVIELLGDKKSIGIALVKEGIGFLQEKPLSLSFKALIISPAEAMTDDAQNALLKTLEEPPEYSLILLISKTENALLETVQSRCRKIKAVLALTSEAGLVGESAKQVIPIDKILKMEIGERLDWAEEFSKEEREDIVEVLEYWVEACHKDIGSAKDSDGARGALNVQVILLTLKDLENSALGARLLLENLVLNLR